MNISAADYYGPLAARILISVLFIVSGFGMVAGFRGTVAYIGSKGLPLPVLGAAGAIGIELGGGIMLVAGFETRLAAAAIFVFTALSAVLFHNFWAAPAGQAENQKIHFMKNVAILGGLLYVMVYGGGPLSIDSYLWRAEVQAVKNHGFMEIR